MSEYTLWPGSRAAIARGCRCPVLDNGHGNVEAAKARGGFWVFIDCPLHGAWGSAPYPEQDISRDSQEGRLL